jgi:Zn-finger nucleic acid-binding protein
MQCLQCDTTLAMDERYTIQIDYCPNCRGIWFKKGKLNKILEQKGSSNRKQDKKQRQNEDVDESSGITGLLWWYALYKLTLYSKQRLKSV